jgi:hypothetical protein
MLRRVTTPNERDCAMLEPIDETWRTELMSRESNGLTVRLLWSRATNLVTIAVADTGNEDYFELVLDEHEPALEVFNHPFAHAAARGLEFRTRRPEPEMLREAA